VLALVTVGAPASGKSTWVKRTLPEHIRDVNLDTCREVVLGDARDQSRIGDVLTHRDALIQGAARDGLDLVVSDTNLVPAFRQALEAMLTGLGYSVRYVLFDTPLEVCLSRNAARERQVPEDVIRRMHRQYLEQRGELLARGAEIIAPGP